VEVTTKATATDPNYGQPVTANQTAVVSLSKDKSAS
jgi:hypothetical protein